MTRRSGRPRPPPPGCSSPRRGSPSACGASAPPRPASPSPGAKPVSASCWSTQPTRSSSLAADGRIVNVNRRAEELYGYAPERAARHAHPRPRVRPRGSPIRRVPMCGRGWSPWDTAPVWRSRRITSPATAGSSPSRCRVGSWSWMEKVSSSRSSATCARERRPRSASRCSTASCAPSPRSTGPWPGRATPERLVSEACRILVAHGGFRMAWIGLGDPATGQVVPAAWVGPRSTATSPR